MPQTASEAEAMTMNFCVTKRRRRWEVEGNSAEETQWHRITVGIYACYPHPR